MEKATSLEEDTMHGARKIALELGLEMKISDVEYQGDNTKATFITPPTAELTSEN